MKTFFFRFILAVAAICTALVVAEMTLLIKFGSARKSLIRDDWHYMYQIYEPLGLPFLRKKKIDGEKMYYFPRSHTFQKPPVNARKHENEFRIVVLGESVAEGFGGWVSLPQAMEYLNSYFPGKTLNFINAGTGAYTSAHILSVAREAVKKLNPDMAVVLMGNNIYGGSALNWKITRSPGFMRYLYLNSWVFRLIFERVYAGIAEREYGFEEFKADYKDLTKLMRLRKIPFAAFRLPVNYADLAPSNEYIYSSRHVMPVVLNSAGRFRESADTIEELIPREGTYAGADALLWYLKGEALRGVGENEKARKAFLEALEIKPGNRTSPSVNEFISRVVTESGGMLVKADRLLEEFSEDGLLGGNFFIDQCHWYNALNNIFASELVSLLNKKHFGNKFREPKKVFSKDDVSEKIDAEKKQVSLLRSIESSLIWHNANLAVFRFRQHIEHHKNEIMGLLQKEPGWYLKYETTNPWMENAVELYKNNWHRILAYIGEALRQEGYLRQAVDFFDSSIGKNPENWEPYFFRALVHIKNNDKENAIRDLEKASRFSEFEVAVDSLIEVSFN